MEAPRLQELNGCEGPLEGDVLVTIGPFEFSECPVRFLDPEDEQIVGLARQGVELPASLERVHLPARYVESMTFMAALRGEANVH